MYVVSIDVEYRKNILSHQSEQAHDESYKIQPCAWIDRQNFDEYLREPRAKLNMQLIVTLFRFG